MTKEAIRAQLAQELQTEIENRIAARLQREQVLEAEIMPRLRQAYQRAVTAVESALTALTQNDYRGAYAAAQSAAETLQAIAADVTSLQDTYPELARALPTVRQTQKRAEQVLRSVQERLIEQADELEAAAEAFVAAGAIEAAVETLQEAARLDPSNQQIVRRLAVLEKSLGKFERKVFVNGSALDATPVMVNGRNLVPLRAVAQALKATVSWDAATRTATITRWDRTVVVPVGSNTVTLNGAPVTLDVPVQIWADKVHVPLRSIAHLLGAEVDYDQATGAVIVVTPASPAAGESGADEEDSSDASAAADDAAPSPGSADAGEVKPVLDLTELDTIAPDLIDLEADEEPTSAPAQPDAHEEH